MMNSLVLRTLFFAGLLTGSLISPASVSAGTFREGCLKLLQKSLGYTEQNRKLDVVRIGDELLRAPSAAVTPEEIKSQSVQNLIEGMLHTLEVDQGVGLSAPQVGVAKR